MASDVGKNQVWRPRRQGKSSTGDKGVNLQPKWLTALNAVEKSRKRKVNALAIGKYWDSQKSVSGSGGNRSPTRSSLPLSFIILKEGNLSSWEGFPGDYLESLVHCTIAGRCGGINSQAWAECFCLDTSLHLGKSIHGARVYSKIPPCIPTHKVYNLFSISKTSKIQ